MTETLAPLAQFVPSALHGDRAALAAACEPAAALCTIVGIDGSFSRRIGAQMAVLADDSTVGSLSDGCLERQLASDVRSLSQPEVRRYGAGSANIDFRLPCGGGLDILLDPAPDRAGCEKVLDSLAKREKASLALPEPSPLNARTYTPDLRLRIFGEGPELAALTRLAAAMQVEVEAADRSDLSLSAASGLPVADEWMAIVMLFHDHEWEAVLLEEALDSRAFYIGAQGGETARIARVTQLLARGVDENSLKRIISPIGLIASCKTPDTLALSVLSEVVARYEGLRAAA